MRRNSKKALVPLLLLWSPTTHESNTIYNHSNHSPQTHTIENTTPNSELVNEWYLLLLAEQLSYFQGNSFKESRNDPIYISLVKQVLSAYGYETWNIKNLRVWWKGLQQVKELQKKLKVEIDGKFWKKTLQVVQDDTWYERALDTITLEIPNPDTPQDSTTLLPYSTQKNQDQEGWETLVKADSNTIVQQENLVEDTLESHSQVIDAMKSYLLKTFADTSITNENKQYAVSVILEAFETWQPQDMYLQKTDTSKVIHAKLSLPDTVMFMGKEVSVYERYEALYTSIQQGTFEGNWEIMNVYIHEQWIYDKNWEFRKHQEWRKYIMWAWKTIWYATPYDVVNTSVVFQGSNATLAKALTKAHHDFTQWTLSLRSHFEFEFDKELWRLWKHKSLWTRNSQEWRKYAKLDKNYIYVDEVSNVDKLLSCYFIYITEAKQLLLQVRPWINAITKASHMKLPTDTLIEKVDSSISNNDIYPWRVREEPWTRTWEKVYTTLFINSKWEAVLKNGKKYTHYTHFKEDDSEWGFAPQHRVWLSKTFDIDWNSNLWIEHEITVSLSKKIYVSSHTHIEYSNIKNTSEPMQSLESDKTIGWLIIENKAQARYFLQNPSKWWLWWSIYIWLDQLSIPSLWWWVQYISEPLQAYTYLSVNSNKLIQLTWWAQVHSHTSRRSEFWRYEISKDNFLVEFWAEYHIGTFRLWPIINFTSESTHVWAKVHYNLK